MAWIPFWTSGEWAASPESRGVKAAIVRTLLLDGTLQSLVTGRVQLAYAATSPTFPLVDLSLLHGEEDSETQRRDEVYRITPWANKRDVVDAIAERVIALIHQKPLDVLGFQFKSARLLVATSVSEDQLFSKELDFRVITYRL